jgi:NAD-dependent deacetylase
VFTGAGISAESGLPTFRSGANAMWKNEDVVRYANPRGYRKHPRDAYAWYSMRARTARSVQPNPGHAAIVDIERRVRNFLLVTQNVDGLHHRAGSANVVELHGSLRQARCFDCGAKCDWPDPPGEPLCPACGGLLRPDVVMFEEMLPAGALDRAADAARRCNLLLAVGTSNQVWPAAEIPQVALLAGATVAIVNPDMDGQAPPSERLHHLVGASGDILPRLVALAFGS